MTTSTQQNHRDGAARLLSHTCVLFGYTEISGTYPESWDPKARAIID